MLFTTGHYSLVSAVLSLLLQVVQSTLVLPVERTTGQGCIPEGRTVSYQCTVTDPLDPPVATTVWLGSAFNCRSAISTANNRITFTHNDFAGGTSGACGALTAVSVGVDGRNYTSRLTLTATAGLNGATVGCSLGGTNEVGTDTIIVQGLPPPPQCATIEVTSTSSLTVSWTPPSDTSNVGGYMFTATGQNCGTCGGTVNVSADTTSVNCSSVNQSCSFEVRTVAIQDCGFLSNPIDLHIRIEDIHLFSSVGNEPFFNTVQEDIVVFEVDANGAPTDLFLDCDVTGHPIVTWYRENEVVDAGNVLDNGTLVVTNITEGEFASRTGVVYHCVATSIIGDPQFNATIRSRDITVHYAFFGGFLNTTTKTLATKAHTTVLPGAPGIDIAMECRVGESQPPPEIEWFRTSGGVTTRLTEVLLEDNRWIYVRNIENFTDTYHCEVANALVHQQLRSPETFSVDQNGLTNDSLRFVYKKIGDLTAFGGDMDFVVSYVSSNGADNLQGVFETIPNSVEVTTSNALGTIRTVPDAPATITVEFRFGNDVIDTGSSMVLGQATIANKPVSDRNVIVGQASDQPQTFSCANTGFPATALEWYYNGVRIDSSLTAIRIVGDELIIDDPQLSNSGLYQCFVRNDVSEDSASWLVEVRESISVCLSECDPEVLGPSPSSRNGPGTVGVANGMVTYNDVTSGSVATLSCDTGFSVANNYTRTCRSDGHWSVGTLNCVQLSLQECDPEVLGPSPSSRNGPGTVGVANGMVTYNGVTSGSVATLSCDTGSSVANNYTRTCRSDGHWSEGTLNCVQDSENALSVGDSITLSVVLTLVLTLIVCVFIGVLSVLVVNKCRRSERITLQTEIEMRPPSAIYEEVDDIKPDPQTQRNTAYGHAVQSELQTRETWLMVENN